MCIRWLINCTHLMFNSGPGSSVGIATGYGLDGPGSNSGGGEIFRTCPDRPWGPPRLLYNGYRVFRGGKKGPWRDADHSPLLVPWSRKSTAIPLLHLLAVRPVQSLSACTRVHFTMFNSVFSSGNIIPLCPYNQLVIRLSDEGNTALTIIFYHLHDT